MNTKKFSRAAKLLSSMLLLAGTSSVFAAATWTFGATPCQPTFTACTASSTTEGAATAKIISAGAYSTTGSGSTFATATLTDQNGSGLGVTAAGTNSSGQTDTATPNHSMDNQDFTDLMVFQFDKNIVLDKVVLGWTYGDADLSIFRWSGSASATSATVLGALAGKTAGNLTSVASTWSLVGNYAATGGPTGTTTADNNARAVDVTVDVNPGAASSSWWIISAYNSAYGALSGTNTTTGSDYMKVLAFVSQNPPTTTPGGNGVPEPGSFALMGAAFAGWFMTRRRAKSAAV